METRRMTPLERRNNAYVHRMAQDMRIRNFAASTIDSYTYHVDKFCSHFGQPADQLTLEHIRDYQLYLVNEKKVSWSSFNQAVCALRFLYEVSLGKPWMIRHIPFGKRPKKLPVVLSDQEASQLIQCVAHLKHRMVLLTCYAAGLRVSEATHLRIADIDGQRQQIRVTSGKGRKERRVPVSPRLLGALREYWKIRRPGNYLFPGRTPDVPLSSATVQKACKLAAATAGINKVGISPHTLRHSFATAMLEAGVDLLTISKLLGHSSFVTTMVYLHVRRQHFDRSPSPIDWLPTRQCPQWAQRLPNSDEAPLAEEPEPPKTQRRSSGRRPTSKRNRRCG
jgi:integrase/recombinase XerD